MDKLHQNFNNVKKAVGWQEVEDDNLPMISRSFLKLCKHHHLIPHLFNIEALQVFIEQTLPPITNEELEFYKENKLIEAYQKDNNPDSPIHDREIGEPALHFHEFIYLLGIIAMNSMTTPDGQIESQLQEFYVQKLHFK